MPAASVKERPIIFSAEMVRAILSDEKTMTRRVVKPQPPSVEEVRALSGTDYHWLSPDGAHGLGADCWRVAGPVWAVRELMPEGKRPELRCPYGFVGDTLWVREAFQIGHETGWRPRAWSLLRESGATDRDGTVFYRADVNPNVPSWRPATQMPRWASRITIEVTGVTIEPDPWTWVVSFRRVNP